MRILGISAFYRDSAAALVVDGRIIAAVQEERFTRIKQDAGFPRHAIEYCPAAGAAARQGAAHPIPPGYRGVGAGRHRRSSLS